MEKHLIVLDLDGTLLTDEKTISPRTKNTLREAAGQGHEIMIATGRPFRSSAPYYTELGLKTPIVNFNGAFVHHPGNNNWGVFHEPMDLNTAIEVVEACQDFGFHNIIAEVLDNVYFHYHDEKLIDIFKMGSPLVTTGDLRVKLTNHPTSLLIHATEEQVPEIRRHLSDVHAEVIDHRRWAAPWHVIEIIKSGLNKAVGLKRVSDSMGIPPDRIIAFGDEDNDLEMIDFAGTGVAMGNGINELKSIANEITASNEEDGIALFLEERLSLNMTKNTQSIRL